MEYNEKLDKLLESTKSKNDACKVLTDEVKAGREEIKNILQAANETKYIGQNGISVSILDVDKTTFNQELVIQYLKEKGLDKYIHTKEYFDESEIAMAMARKEIDATDFAPFTIEKHELRVLIK